MSEWTFEYAMEQAKLVLNDNGKLHSHGFVCDMLAPIVDKIEKCENTPGVWDGAPEWATTAHIQWTNGQYNHRTYVADQAEWRREPYTRTLPKTKAREIAERVAKENCTFSPEYTVSLWADIIESAILEAQKGGK